MVVGTIAGKTAHLAYFVYNKIDGTVRSVTAKKEISLDFSSVNFNK